MNNDWLDIVLPHIVENYGENLASKIMDLVEEGEDEQAISMLASLGISVEGILAEHEENN